MTFNPDIRIFQIFYDENSEASLDRGFIPLDNKSNGRPDWKEYQPMRKYLLEHSLDHNAYYGFLSPRFNYKTGLTSTDVIDFVQANAHADVVLFSPAFDQSAFFRNVFEQGEIFHPGLIQTSRSFLADISINIDLNTLVTDSTLTVFCNYFVAKPDFWKKWLEIGEMLYHYCEIRTSITCELNKPTGHRGENNVDFKVFLMERLATLLLAMNDGFTVIAYDPFKLPAALPSLSGFQQQAIICDALKIAYRRHNNPVYIDTFYALRRQVFESMPKHKR